MAIHPIDPIYLWDGYVSRGLIDVEGAARFLTERWPAKPTAAYLEAASACRASIRGDGTAADARAAVIEAAESEGILDRKAMLAPIGIPTGKSKHWRTTR